jgi:hypothetical protein
MCRVIREKSFAHGLRKYETMVMYGHAFHGKRVVAEAPLDLISAYGGWQRLVSGVSSADGREAAG